jgi:hypothetical protein
LNSVFVFLFFVLYTLCCQFLWIIQFWLSLRYSLTFISLCQRLSFLFYITITAHIPGLVQTLQQRCGWTRIMDPKRSSLNELKQPCKSFSRDSGRIVLSNTYWIVFLFSCSSSCTPYVANFSGLFNFDCPLAKDRHNNVVL